MGVLYDEILTSNYGKSGVFQQQLKIKSASESLYWVEFNWQFPRSKIFFFILVSGLWTL